MRLATTLCALWMLISFSGCGGKAPEPPKMERCVVPYTPPADVNNTPCPRDAHFYTCVRIKTMKNHEAKKHEATVREINEGVCR